MDSHRDNHGRKNIVHLDEWRKNMFHKLRFLTEIAEGIHFLFNTIYKKLLVASDMAMGINIEDTRDTRKDVHFASENNETRFFVQDFTRYSNWWLRFGLLNIFRPWGFLESETSITYFHHWLTRGFVESNKQLLGKTWIPNAKGLTCSRLHARLSASCWCRVF